MLKGLIQHLLVLLKHTEHTATALPIAFPSNCGDSWGRQQNCFPSENKRSATVPFLGPGFRAEVPPAAQRALMKWKQELPPEGPYV